MRRDNRRHLEHLILVLWEIKTVFMYCKDHCRRKNCKNELNILSQIAVNNNYPKSLIDKKILRIKCRNRLKRVFNNSRADKDDFISRSIPFLGPISYKIEKIN